MTRHDHKISLAKVSPLKPPPHLLAVSQRRMEQSFLPVVRQNAHVYGNYANQKLSRFQLTQALPHAPSESITYGLKRVVDIVASGVLFVFLLPFMIIVWCLVRVTSAGPGLHWSWRVGFGGHMFWMPKFRTMPVGTRQIAREAFGVGGVATTSIGQFLRKLSIDELPQLWSVVVGDMSLVGPRPLLGNDPTTAIRQRRFPQCFNVRPGITGLAQVNGRNSVKPLTKARYDAFYAGRCSFDIDVHILLATARAVLDVRRIL